MRKVTMPLLAAAAGVTMMALGCPPTARSPVTPAPEPPPDPPPPLETEMRWTIGPDDFGDDNGAIWGESSNRSEPYEWDRITAGNVRVSIDGTELPSTGGNPPALANTWYEPIFDDDVTGADWTVTAEVETGAVVLALTAPDDFYRAGPVIAVVMTNGGSGYTEPPTVIFGSGEDSDATGFAVGPGMVTGVAINNVGAGYTSAPTVTFSTPAGTGGVTATGTAAPSATGTITDVTITNPGSGYTGTPTVTITGGGATIAATGVVVVQRHVSSVTITNGGVGYRTRPPVTFTGGSGNGAAGFAVLPQRDNDQFQNLYFARQTLYGRELLVEYTGQ